MSPTRRQVLLAGVGIGAGGLVYATDNAIHRRTVGDKTTRQATEQPHRDTFWFARAGPPHSDSKTEAALLTGVRYLGPNDTQNGFFVDVIAVVVGDPSAPDAAADRPTHHALAVRGIDGATTLGADSGQSDQISSGVVEPPAALVDRTSLSKDELDDRSALESRIETTDAFGTKQELRTAGMLQARSRSTDPQPADRRVTLAGLLYGLHMTTTELRAATPEFEGRGETYTAPEPPGAVHVMHYRRLEVTTEAADWGLQVRNAVGRPSLLGTPERYHDLVVTVPS